MRRIRARMFVGGVAVGLTSVLGSVGCFPRQTNRAQVADDTDTDKDRFATIGSKTEIGNAESIPVSGVGLVYGLRGTGSSPPAVFRFQTHTAVDRGLELWA